MVEARTVYGQISDVIRDLEQALKNARIDIGDYENELEHLTDSVQHAVNELEKIRYQVAS
jgi:hypothetical protein